MELKRPSLVGKLHNSVCNNITNIFTLQHEKGIKSGIRGFILYGPPGTGKSTIARTVVYDTSLNMDLAHFNDDQVYDLLNLADIARARFGDTENIIREKFELATRISKENGGFFIIVMDDVDGMFPTRDYHKLDAWYLGHLNVLFTELDKLETNKVGVIMTTNRKDLLDDAVISRLATYEVPFIDIETAKLKIKSRIKELKMDSSYMEIIIKEIKKKLDDGSIQNLSFRDVEKEIIYTYMKWIESNLE